MEYFKAYQMTLLATGGVGFLLLLQLLVVDFVAIRQKHRPGHPVEANHEDLLFRAVRAQANTNEGISIFLLFVIFGIASGGNPMWLNISALLYFAGRLAHMLCYYANLKAARSVSFGLGLIGLIGMFVAGVMPWVG